MTLEKQWKFQCFALRVLMVKTHNIRVWAKSCPGYFSQQPRRRFERKGGMMPLYNLFIPEFLMFPENTA